MGCSTVIELSSLEIISLKRLATKYWQHCYTSTVLIIPNCCLCWSMVLVEMWVYIISKTQFHFHIWDFLQNLAVFLLRTWLFLQITPSLSIYDTMQILRSPIGTRCVGSAYNLSAFLLAAGDKVIFSWGTKSEASG